MHTREERAAFHASAGAYTPLLGLDADGLRFVVPTADTGLARRLFAAQRRSEMKILSRVLKLVDKHAPRDRQSFIDVGANIGTTTLPALLTHGFRRAVAIEPDPENRRLLAANAELNDVRDRVRIVDAAAGVQRGSLVLRRHRTNCGGHRISSGADPAKDEEKISVRSLRLDELVKPREAGLIWVDVQGHEPDVLLGATKLLRAGVPLVFECAKSFLAADGISKLVAATRGYTHLVDLRAPREILAAGEPASFIENLDGQTDLLMLRGDRSPPPTT